jgi:hypothetical protein
MVRLTVTKEAGLSAFSERWASEAGYATIISIIAISVVQMAKPEIW